MWSRSSAQGLPAQPYENVQTFKNDDVGVRFEKLKDELKKLLEQQRQRRQKHQKKQQEQQLVGYTLYFHYYYDISQTIIS